VAERACDLRLDAVAAADVHAQPDGLADRDRRVRLDVRGLEVAHLEEHLREPLVSDRERDAVAEPGRDELGVLEILDRLDALPIAALTSPARDSTSASASLSPISCAIVRASPSMSRGELVVAVLGMDAAEIAQRLHDADEIRRCPDEDRAPREN